jgi:trans-2,3-dihydro-3-hydroxyanthranilate isomerase
VSNPNRSLPFVQLDVFTAVALEGNQLAVFPDARGLSDQEMQAIARETNLSETTFIFPRDIATEQERGTRVRIFTTTEELPFAGHPTLGTAMVLRGDTNREEVALELNVGKIPVRFSTRDGLPFGLMTQRNPEFGQTHSREDVARAAGIPADQIADDVPIQTVSTGNAFAMVKLKSLSTLQNLKAGWSSLEAYLKKTDAKFLYFVSTETVNPEAKLQSRMIFYNGEDPATGSAAGPCIAWAVKNNVVPAGKQALIEQGVEMKRRSRIYVSAERDGDKIVNVRVGGHAVEVVRGQLSF